MIFVSPPLRQRLYLILSFCNSHNALLSESNEKQIHVRINRKSALTTMEGKKRKRGNKFIEIVQHNFSIERVKWWISLYGYTIQINKHLSTCSQDITQVL